MKIKVFRFRVSTCERGKAPISEYEIEAAVNEFVKDKKVVSISVSNVDVLYHNNGGNNIVDLIYTIMFEEV